MKVAAILAMVISLSRVWYMPAVVVGTSMEPTLGSGEIHLVDQRAFVTESPKRGDVVLVRDEEAGEVLVKRVMALPGEEVKMIWGRIYINGELLDEPYRHPATGWCMLPIQVGVGQFWVIGDHRDVSSHLTVRRAEIVGKLISEKAHSSVG